MSFSKDFKGYLRILSCDNPLYACLASPSVYSTLVFLLYFFPHFPKNFRETGVYGESMGLGISYPTTSIHLTKHNLF